MSCDAFRQVLLDLGWDEPARQRAAALLNHLEGCSDCKEAARDFDRLRETLGSFQTNAEPTGGWAAFQERLEASHRPVRFAWRAPVLAIAASLLIGGLAFQLGRMFSTPGKPSLAVAPVNNSTTTSPSFAPPQLSHEVRAFDQVSKVFDGRASWMLVSDEASDVGVVPHAMASSRHVLLLRLTMTRGGNIASDADLLVVPGQTANLTVPLEEGHSLHYRIGTSNEEPTRLSVWLEVNTPRGGEPIAALSTNLEMTPGQKVTAGQLATTAGEYELKIGFARADLPEGTP